MHRTLFAGLVDDASLFPPGSLPMTQALAEHAAHEVAPYADLVGPFLCPASRVDELVEVLPREQEIELSMVLDVGGEGAHQALSRAAADPRITLVAVEVAHAHVGDDAATVGKNLHGALHVRGFLEVPRTGFDSSLDLVGCPGWHAAKYRTGGANAAAFPTEPELATFLVAVAGRGVPFKLTAGLHHAVRSTDPATGFEQHGVLNVLVGTRLAQGGAAPADVAVLLAERRPESLVRHLDGWDLGSCAEIRRAFLSFGCCGVTDPIGELAALRLVDA